MTWNTGKNEVIGLIERGELDRVHPDTDFAHILIQKAEQHLRSAAAIAGNDPEGAYALTHDAIRSAFSAVLQAQGLRGTTRGGHLAPQTAVQAQLGAVASVALRPANRIRVTRNNAEYPKSQNDFVDSDELDDAMSRGATIVELCGKSIDHMPVFRD